MRKILLTVSILLVGLSSLLIISTAASAANNYDQNWSEDMNHTNYWLPWQCTKYNNHNGWIPAQYDAAIVKAGTKVRVYPDLREVGAFQASAPDGKEISWVMKCTFPKVKPPVGTAVCPEGGVYWISTWTVPKGFVPLDLRYSDNNDGTYTGTHQWNETEATFTGYVLLRDTAIVVSGKVSQPPKCTPATTTTTTTTTTTEVSTSTTTTTTVPTESTSTTSLAPATTTSVVPSTSAPTTTAPEVTTTSPETTTTVMVAVTTPPVPTTTVSPTEVELPETGAGTTLVVLGFVFLAFGLMLYFVTKRE